MRNEVSEAPLTLREVMTNAIRYWEFRRLYYNAVLLLVVMLCFIIEWPESRQALQTGSLLGFFILAVLANVAYCAAYVPDIALQYSSFREGWLEWRFVLLHVGVLFAAVVAWFFSYLIFRPMFD